MSMSLLVTIVLMVLALCIALGLWARSRRARPLVAGLGWMVVPLGLWILGVMDLAVNGVMSIVAWLQRTVWDDMMTTGAVIAGVGLLCIIVALSLPSAPKERKPVEARPSQRPVGAPAGRPAFDGKVDTSKQASQPRAAAKPGQKTGLSEEDQEIEALLKKRGIM